MPNLKQSNMRTRKKCLTCGGYELIKIQIGKKIKSKCQACGSVQLMLKSEKLKASELFEGEEARKQWEKQIKQSNWEEFVKKVLLPNKCGYLRFEVKKLLDRELAERDIEITNLEEDIEMLEDELKEKDETWRNYYGIERDKRDAQWLSCLPEGEHITTAHTYRKRIFNNAKKLKLIE